MAHFFLTGVSSGIGAETAKILLQEGHNVSGIARRKHRLDDLASPVTGFSYIL